MRGSKLIILFFLFLASNVFGQGSLATISNAISSVVYPSTNLPPRMVDRHWDYSRLTNMNNVAVFRLLRHDGFHLAGANDAALLNASNAICITNIPGIQGSGIFFNRGAGVNVSALYITRSNQFADYPNLGDPEQVQKVTVTGVWVTNGATSSNPNYARFINIAGVTNATMAIGDVFNNSGPNVHFSFTAVGFQPAMFTNMNTGNYTGEDYLGRVFVQTRMASFPSLPMSYTDYPDNYAGRISGARWELGWEFLSETAIRLWSGPNEMIRTIDALPYWKPVKSVWIESVSNDNIEQAVQFLIQGITISYHKNSSWPQGLYYETNWVNGFRMVSLRGNVLEAREGVYQNLSVANSATNSTNAVNLASLQNALRTNGAVGSVTQTNFNLLQIYTNNSGLVQAYSGRVGLVPAAVVGNVGVLAFLSRDNGATFSPVGGVSEGTAIGLTVAPTTNGFFFALNTNDQCYFTNISSGIGNSAGLVAGSGQVTLMGASTATIITATNATTAQYLIGSTNSLPYVETNYVNGGATLVAMVVTNTSPTSLITKPTTFIVAVTGSGTATASTNQFRVNFGTTFRSPPLVSFQYSNGQTNSAAFINGFGQFHVAANTVTTSNFNVCSGASSLFTTLTNHYQVFVVGSEPL